jgi:hypothetical protein
MKCTAFWLWCCDPGGEIRMTPQDQLNTFLNAYASYVKTALQPTQEEMRAILEQWRQPAHWEKYKRTNRIPIPTPIRTVFSRIKRPEQVVDKVLRKTENFPAGLTPDSIPCMHDALGIRIVVWFLSHLPLVDRELRNSDLFEISEAAPATAYMTAHRANLLSLGHLHQGGEGKRLLRGALHPASEEQHVAQERKAMVRDPGADRYPGAVERDGAPPGLQARQADQHRRSPSVPHPVADAVGRGQPLRPAVRGAESIPGGAGLR